MIHAFSERDYNFYQLIAFMSNPMILSRTSKIHPFIEKNDIVMFKQTNLLTHVIFSL